MRADATDVATQHPQLLGNIPRGILEFRLSSTPELAIRDLKIILYCKTSGRAALSALALGEMGYVNVSSIAGGFDAWVAEAKAVATPSLPAFEYPKVI